MLVDNGELILKFKIAQTIQSSSFIRNSETLVEHNGEAALAKIREFDSDNNPGIQ